jgi:methenyltetrahydromethanopterin cyclohydrolase
VSTTELEKCSFHQRLANLSSGQLRFLGSIALTNYAILCGGVAQRVVECDDKVAADLSRRLPFCCSRDYGRSFGDLCDAAGYDFYKTDQLLFSPARAVGSKLATGNTFAAGTVNAELLRPLWLSQDR